MLNLLIWAIAWVIGLAMAFVVLLWFITFIAIMGLGGSYVGYKVWQWFKNL